MLNIAPYFNIPVTKKSLYTKTTQQFFLLDQRKVEKFREIRRYLLFRHSPNGKPFRILYSSIHSLIHLSIVISDIFVNNPRTSEMKSFISNSRSDIRFCFIAPRGASTFVLSQQDVEFAFLM